MCERDFAVTSQDAKNQFRGIGKETRRGRRSVADAADQTGAAGSWEALTGRAGWMARAGFVRGGERGRSRLCNIFRGGGRAVS